MVRTRLSRSKTDTASVAARHLPDPQLHNRICTDLSLFHDRQGYLARDGSFLNLLLGKGFHQAMSRFLVVHPAAVQSPFEEMNAMLGPRSVLEVVSLLSCSSF